MTVQAYRVFKKTNTLPINVGHLFSIVADENKASFATPKGDNIYDFAGFSQSRIDSLISEDEPKPDTPEKWAEIAKLCMSMVDVFLTDEEYATFEEAIAQETIKATEAWHLRNSETIS
jgi:hypothetical protein